MNETKATYEQLQETIGELNGFLKLATTGGWQLNRERAALQAENAQLHIKLADAQLQARLGWERYENANRDRNHLRSLMLQMPKVWLTDRQAVYDHLWQMYKTGQMSADHTSKQVFEETIESFALWVAEQFAGEKDGCSN